jgi:hypothetical protein
MVHLKNITKILLAFLSAFIITELLTYNVLGFPRWGIDKQVYGIKPYGKKIYEIYKPHSEYINFENGYKVFKRNNLGLQGIDIDTNPSNKYVFLLGDSYTQAAEINPDNIASSKFQKLIRQKNYSVLNLASGGEDPYYMYFHSRYYMEKYNPELVFLIISKSYIDWLDSRYIGLNFDLPPNFGKQKNSWRFSPEEIFLCNKSSFLYLLDMAIKSNNKEENIISESNYQEKNEITPKLFDCLKAFRYLYQNKFVLISISADTLFNKNINDFCRKENILFFANCLNIPENKIKGYGHFNEKGNQELCNFLYDIWLININKFNASNNPN